MTRNSRIYLNQATAIYADALAVYQQADKDGKTTAARPDSMGEGRIGFAFFMVELLAATADPQVRASIDSEIRWLEAHAAAHPTNNYTLFKGRLALGFLYLKLYECTKEEALLHQAVAMAEEFYGSISFRNNIINRTSYFDGMSGVLSFTHQLYRHTGSPWLLTYVQKYTLALVGTCHQGHNGIFWGGVSNKESKNNGLANGTAGIALTLQQVSKTFDNSVLQTIAATAFAYEEWCLEEQKRYAIDHQAGAGTYALATGYLGTELALLHGQADPHHSLERLTRFAQSIDASFLQQFAANKPAYGLFSGLAGVGVALVEAAKQLETARFTDSIQLIVEHLAAVYADEQQRPPATLEGSLGIGYLYIRLAQLEASPSALFFLPTADAPAAAALPAAVFGEHSQVLLHAFFSSSYKKTLSAIQAELPELYQEVMAAAQQADLDNFSAVLSDKLHQFEPAAQTEKIRVLFAKESFKVSIIKKVEPADMYTIADVVEADRVLQLEDGEFKNLQLERPRGVWMYSKTSFDPKLTQFTNESLYEFVQHYGADSSFYVVTSLDKLSENVPGLLQFICERFAEPTPVHKVIDSVTEAFLCNDAVLPLAQQIFQATDMPALKTNIEAYVVEGTKLCIAEGLLRNDTTWLN